MRILLLVDRPELKDKLAFLLQTTFGAQVTSVESFLKGSQILQQPGLCFDLLIVDMKSGDREERESFWSHTRKTLTLYFNHDRQDLAPHWSYVISLEEGKNLVETLEDQISELIKKGQLEGASGASVGEGQKEEALCRIKTSLLLSVAPLRADIYIQLSEKKYLKVFHQGDTFEQSDLEKYTVKKGIQYLYVRTEDCEEFARKYRQEILKMLDKGDPSHDHIVRTATPVHEMIQQLGRQVGFSRDVQELAKAQVQATVQAMNKDMNLAEILTKLKTESDGYVAIHSMMIAYVACVIAKKVKWSSATTYHKLTLAAFMHDIIFENQELASLDNLAQLEAHQSQFSQAEIHTFKEHPNTVAEIARKFNEVPPDVDTIIAQHHERPDGSGFPRKLSGMHIAPLAAIFIISHDLVQYFLKSNMKFNAKEFMAISNRDYKTGHFKKIMSTVDVIRQIEELDRAMNTGATSPAISPF